MSEHTTDDHSRHPDPQVQRLLELLADRATSGLKEHDHAELARLMALVPNAAALEAEFDAVEGGLVLAAHASSEPLPADLRARLLDRGLAMVGDEPISRREHARAADSGPIPIAVGRRAALVSQLGWVAAAAAILLAGIAWWPSATSQELPTTANERLAILRHNPDSISVVLDPGNDPAGQGVVAEVVWSTSRQEGYLRVRGLAVNDPATEQYQLWITDATRDDRYAIDAGVFDITLASMDPQTREVVIPIRPGLAVGSPMAFALTVERPGGVVVSDRTRLVAIATVG